MSFLFYLVHPLDLQNPKALAPRPKPSLVFHPSQPTTQVLDFFYLSAPTYLT